MQKDEKSLKRTEHYSHRTWTAP